MPCSVLVQRIANRYMYLNCPWIEGATVQSTVERKLRLNGQILLLEMNFVGCARYSHTVAWVLSVLDSCSVQNTANRSHTKLEISL